MADFLESLAPRVVPVTVTLPYGTTITISMYTMTMHKWDELGEAVAEPVAPFLSHNSRGEEIRSYTDPGYLKARRQAESERAYRRLTYALVKGGNEIEGDLFEDKVKRVREELDLSLASALMAWQRSLIAESRARVVALAETFQPGQNAATAGDDALPPERFAVGGAV